MARHAWRFGSGPVTTPALLVGIDTEGDNQWDLRARQEQTFENIYALPKLHALFERHGVRPTYVVTWPVASDERSQQVLRYLLLRGDCEIGAHHHAWETPPCTPDDVARHPYASTLPLAQFEAQLAELTAAITRATGERPVSYRSGRFGFHASHVAALEREGYLVESSVAPLFYEVRKGGPDFVEAPLRPYFLSYDSAVSPGPAASSRCRVRRRCTVTFRIGWRGSTRGRRFRTRPAACCGNWGWRAWTGCDRRTPRSTPCARWPAGSPTAAFRC